jgi:hypothetical protein
MSNFQQLQEVDGKLQEAIGQLREQQTLVAKIDFARANQRTFLALLSNALRQFGWLERERASLIKKSSSELRCYRDTRNSSASKGEELNESA